MFESFNFSEFAVIFAIYVTLLIASQMFMPKLVGLLVNKSNTYMYAPAILVLVTVAAWVATIAIYRWEAAAVLAIGAILEPTITYLRRKSLVAAIIESIDGGVSPVNFNDINGKAL